MNIVQNLTMIEISEQDCLLVQGGNSSHLIEGITDLTKSVSDKVEKPDLDYCVVINTQP